MARSSRISSVRANQRDIYHVSSFREQIENVLRSWLGKALFPPKADEDSPRPLGTRWLTRWDREVDLLTKLVYYGITVGRGQIARFDLDYWLTEFYREPVTR